MNKDTEEHLTETPEEQRETPASQEGNESVETSETTP